jgi:hypothetical protein
MSQTRLKEYRMVKKALLIGLDPSVVDYERWSHLSPEKLVAALRADESRQNELGYDAEICFIDHGETPQKTVRGYLDGDGFDCVRVGAGVRTDAEGMHPV